MRVIDITSRHSRLIKDNNRNISSRRRKLRKRSRTKRLKPNASPGALLIPPSLLTATSLQIDWTNDCTNEHNVKVYQSTINSRSTADLTGSILAEGATGIAITGLVEETSYYFWVEFFNGYGKSVQSPQQIYSTTNPTVDSTSFISTWETTSSSEQVTLPFVSSGSINFTIDWGDGSSIDTVTAYDDDLGGGGIDHTYSTADTYTITMAGTIKGFKFANSGDKTKIKSITQWGTFDLTQPLSFYGCTYLVVSAADAPTVSSADIGQAFQNCEALTSLGDGVSLWDISSVTNMSNMFNGSAFNGDISGWDTGEVTNMTYMFGWNSQFNQNIGSWDVSNVTNMSTMFYQATAFNGNIGSWGTKTGAVTNMYSMFYNCDAFNQDIGSWDTTEVTNMSSMFRLAHIFNQDITDWNTVKVTNMGSMFQNATAFNQDINTSATVKWNTAEVTNMSYMFSYATNFNGNISGWDTSKVTSGNDMFVYATSFNQDIGSWNTGLITNMSYMFYNATAFNQDISDWNTAAVTNMSNAFRGTTAYNQPMNTDGSKWDTSSVTTMSYMFKNATAFNQNIGGWDVTSVTTMQYLFQGATVFNNGGSPDINDWRPTSSSTFFGIFNQAAAFNQSLSSWQFRTAGGVDCTNMFYGANNFNSALAWGSQVQYIDVTAGMFGYTPFNQDISGWNTSNVINMNYMFRGATDFNQDISSWDVNQVTVFTNFLYGNTALSTANYNALLVAWEADDPIDGLSFHAGDAEYSGAGATARAALIATHNWTITDGGLNTDFISTWGTAGSSEADRTVTLPLVSSGSINFTIDWGDSTAVETITAYDDADRIHIYASEGTYTVTMVGTINGFKFNNGGDKTKLKSITNWGTFDISTDAVFYGCSALTVSATDAPTISSNSLQYTFYNATIFNGDVSGWDVSGVTNMYHMFFDASAFNNGGSDNINNWNVSSVTGMGGMFNRATVFNQNIGSWDVSSVTLMNGMFQTASAFNQDLGGWDTGEVTNMSNMFYQASDFNNGGEALTEAGNNWDVSKVTNMQYTFRNATDFNADISDWTVSAVTNMKSMFNTATSFNQDIGSWNTGAVTTMDGLFATAAVFNQNLNSWNTSSVTNMWGVFYRATAFNGAIGNWNTSAATTMSYMFYDASAFNQDINTDGSKWDTSSVTTMSYMFKNATAFNQDIAGWNTAVVTDMTAMFRDASAFNNGGVAPNWDMTKCQYFIDMFYGATSFNQDLSGCTGIGIGFGGNVRYKSMFAYATAFDQNIGHFDVTNINTSAWYGMSNMLLGAGLSTINYNATLMAWNAVDATDGVAFHGGDSIATGMALAARAALISNDSWTITDATQ